MNCTLYDVAEAWYEKKKKTLVAKTGSERVGGGDGEQN